MMKQTAQYEMKLDDSQWQQLEPLLIGRPGDPGVSARNNRLFIEALLWVVLNQAPWSSLPPQFGRSSTAYMRFRRWNECDFWRQLACSKVDDAQLQQLLDTVVAYGDRYTARLEQRIARKAKKTVYRSAAGSAASVPTDAHMPSPAMDSTSHWVGLLNPVAVVPE